MDSMCVYIYIDIMMHIIEESIILMHKSTNQGPFFS